jgi:hypothetical protein
VHDVQFDSFWDVVTKRAQALSVNEPLLPRCRKLPHRIDGGLSGGDFVGTPKVNYKQCYFEALVLKIGLTNQVYHPLETPLLKAWS